ncbi:MAG: VOC family protein [Bacteroidetes bacterium]|nr:MAG: VOC family protein [Bacteroidota bacterium]
MTMFISGIQQVGIGVQNVHEAFRWYRRHFGMDVPVFEEAATAGLMLPYTGGQPQDRHAILALNMQGGGGMEIWQYTGRTPVAPAFEPQLGDLGIFAGKIKCKDVQACLKQLREQGVEILGECSTRPDDLEHFFVKDPWGNIFEIVSSNSWFAKNRPVHTGGMYGTIIGVSDMDRSIDFYKTILGYDNVIYDTTDQFSDLEVLGGGDKQMRRVLLGHTAQRRGPFSRLLGDTEIELVQLLDTAERPPKRIYENRYWGDLGFIHLCFDITGMAELKEVCATHGHPFTVDSSGSFDMGEAAGYFAYIEDPDGTLIEFVETHKVPILKKLNWYLHLNRRSDPAKPLPNLIIKAMGLGRVKD